MVQCDVKDWIVKSETLEQSLRVACSSKQGQMSSASSIAWQHPEIQNRQNLRGRVHIYEDKREHKSDTPTWPRDSQAAKRTIFNNSTHCNILNVLLTIQPEMEGGFSNFDLIVIHCQFFFDSQGFQPHYLSFTVSPAPVHRLPDPSSSRRCGRPIIVAAAVVFAFALGLSLSLSHALSLSLLQPVKDTREKQIQLWKELILDYCRTQKFFIIELEKEFPLFTNPVIERSLSHEARDVFLSALVSDGRAEWMDKGHRKCLILWHRIQDWSDLILRFVKDNGLEDSVMTVEEIRSGTESRGTELHGIDRTVLMRALKLLEHKGKLTIFKGTSADDEGVKFSI
ncbi:E2F/DP family winged-helix DNA-binding domain-containing protein [Actinidia rufa]|uniref:ESCRT-II complex subunit VPS25 n=1 Tax=Actinidia rufa TaxID=165716 RepID=A0A7J0GD94_9ERIC|nr:E2F/DP family winged-helix DNA-binding domain-containing protein [Actinidia rufa]